MEGFASADVRGVVCNAQLKRIDRLASERKEGEEEREEDSGTFGFIEEG